MEEEVAAVVEAAVAVEAVQVLLLFLMGWTSINPDLGMQVSQFNSRMLSRNTSIRIAAWMVPSEYPSKQKQTTCRASLFTRSNCSRSTTSSRRSSSNCSTSRSSSTSHSPSSSSSSRRSFSTSRSPSSRSPSSHPRSTTPRRRPSSSSPSSRRLRRPRSLLPRPHELGPAPPAAGRRAPP